MKEGSVFVDVAIDQGGISSFSRVAYHDKPIYKVHGVSFYTVANMPGSVPRTASVALNNVTLNYGLEIANKGLSKAARENPIIASGIQTNNGRTVLETLVKVFESDAA